MFMVSVCLIYLRGGNCSWLSIASIWDGKGPNPPSDAEHLHNYYYFYFLKWNKKKQDFHFISAGKVEHFGSDIIGWVFISWWPRCKPWSVPVLTVSLYSSRKRSKLYVYLTQIQQCCVQAVYDIYFLKCVRLGLGFTVHDIRWSSWTSP